MPALRPVRRSAPSPHRLVVGLFGVGVILALASIAQAAPIGVAGGWMPGEWQVTSGRETRTHCALDIGEMIYAGGRPLGPCRSTVVRDDGQQLVVRWTCRNGDQGQSEVRRDTEGLLVAHSQGIRDRRPFRDRSEWRRTGDCAVAAR